MLSVAYILGDPKGTAADEYEKVRAENDWTSAQVARFPERLVGFLQRESTGYTGEPLVCSTPAIDRWGEELAAGLSMCVEHLTQLQPPAR